MIDCHAATDANLPVHAAIPHVQSVWCSHEICGFACVHVVAICANLLLTSDAPAC